MDIVLEGAFHSLAEHEATIEMNSRIDMLLMAMESYKIFSVLLGGEDEEDNDLLNAMESYNDTDFEEAFEALSTDPKNLSKEKKALYDDVEDIVQSITGGIYKRKPKLKQGTFENMLKTATINHSNKKIKDAVDDSDVYACIKNAAWKLYEDLQDEGNKTGKYTEKVTQYQADNETKTKSEKTEAKAKKSFAEVVKEFFKVIGDWFRKVFGNKEGELVDGEVIMLQGLDDPDTLHEKAAAILDKVINSNDEKEIEKYAQELRNMLDAVSVKVTAEAGKARKQDKYVGVKRFIHPSLYGKKVNELSRKAYLLKPIHMKSLELYEKILNEICKGIYKKNGVEEIHKSITKVQGKIGRQISKTNKAYKEFEEESLKRSAKGKSET